jgi:predicted RNase H-like HicB family nuclease
MDMVQEFNVVIEQDEDGFFVASVPSLPGCHTQARSVDVLIERVREAIELYVEVEGLPVSPLSFVGVEQVTIAA